MRPLPRHLSIIGGLHLFVLLCAAMAGVAAANAATLTVTNAADIGPGSLRATIAAANDGDIIQFDGTLNGEIIDLTSDELVIDKNISINGPGPSQLTVQRSNEIGTPSFRIFHLLPGSSVTIAGLTIANGSADFGGSVFVDHGGGIFADHATLTINGCSVLNNVAKQGGGIYNDGGSIATLTIVNTIIISNGAFGAGPSISGSGIYNQSGAVTILNTSLDGNSISSTGDGTLGGGIYNNAGAMEIIDSLVVDNFGYTSQPDPHFHGNSSGIGIYNALNGTLAIRNSTVSGNYTSDLPFGGYGGGIYNDGTAEITGCTVSGNFPSTNGGGIYNTGTAEITDSTVRQNTTRRGGGGIYNDGTLTITSSTLSNNMAVDRLLGYGGGLVNSGDLTIVNSTLSDNHADGSGGGIHNSGPLTIAHSTLSDNFSYPNGLNSGGSIRNVGRGMLQLGNTILNAGSADPALRNSAKIVSHGYNLCGDNGGGMLRGRGDRINTNPMLGPLQNNGGPTFTHELLTGSPAINAGDPNFIPPPLYDQRGAGYNRVVSGRIDIGSFEVQ